VMATGSGAGPMDSAEHPRLPALESVGAYLAARPIGVLDSARLFLGYGASLAARAVLGRHFSSVGRFLPGHAPLEISFSGYRAYVRPGTNDLDLLVHHEPRTASWFRVRPGEVVVDVGAHIGRYTLPAALTGSLVVAIEPDPSNFIALRRNVELNGFRNVVLKNCAVSDRDGSRTLFLAGGPNRGTSSLDPQWAPGVGGAAIPESVEVACDTLDHILLPVSPGRIDWLKIDVEGHEVQVLGGANLTLGKTNKLILEVSKGLEERCRELTAAARFDLLDVERGSPTSNWLLERHP
jgi:FkbM family methyltransferase